MADKIKLENIVQAGFSPTDGKSKLVLTNELVCSNCRHLVASDSAFCWQCGEQLTPSSIIEHYEKGVKLDQAAYEIKKIGAEPTATEIKIPKELS